MRRVVIRRLLWSIPTVWAVSALTFVLASLAPGNGARAILGMNGSPEAYARVRAQLGLDRPVYIQYWHWLTNAVRGDLGRSIFSDQSVTSILNSRLAVTLSLILGTTVITVALGVCLGVFSAVRGGVSARLVDAGSLVGMSVPSYWLGLVLIAVFAVWLRLFPAIGYVPIEQSPGGWARSLVLPVAALAISGVASIATQTRGAMIDVFGRDFVRALCANGLPTRSIIFQHSLKNAAIPVVTVIGLLMIGLLGGTVFIEGIFALPGLGAIAVTATRQHDLPVVEGIAVYYAVIVVVINLLTDLAYAWLNPKVVTS
jgi:peptide/nickel transport system permease protein